MVRLSISPPLLSLLSLLHSFQEAYQISLSSKANADLNWAVLVYIAKHILKIYSEACFSCLLCWYSNNRGKLGKILLFLKVWEKSEMK